MTAGASRLRELGERWSLDSRQLATLERIVEMLVSDPLAPSAVAPDAVLDVHVADSLSALALPEVTRARTVADLGSGAGFPGLALAVALPRARVALVESVSRKCRFLERVCSGAGVENAHVVHARAERWPDGLGRHDLVTARALAPLAVLCEYAAPLLASGGTLVAWKGEIGLSEAQMGERAASLLGLEPGGVVRTEPYAGSVAHHLHSYRKVAPTPPGYPRRPGVARKRPLGGAP
ncbi:MAG: 16S rRNA (guanine(527)-N(7))-methyltransferase RsmG [Solirubrobacteraceae bacterium]